MKKIYTTLFVMAVALSASAQITLNKPEAKPATNITSTGFTANWGAVKDCDGYALFVYDRKKVTANGEVTIADENFNGITGGNINEPLGGDEEYVDLSATDMHRLTDGAHTDFLTSFRAWLPDWSTRLIST